MSKALTAIETVECPYEEWTDEDLLIAYRDEKDTEAFNELVKRHERPLFSYLRRRLGDAGLAEDVFQETFINVIRKVEQFQGDKKFSSWLYAIATNLSIDYQRKNKRHTKLSLDVKRSGSIEGDGTLSNLLPGNEPEGSDVLSDAENMDWIRAHFRDLQDTLRIPVELVYFQRMKYREVADILDIPVGTVKSRLHQAILNMRIIWNESHILEQIQSSNPESISHQDDLLRAG